MLSLKQGAGTESDLDPSVCAGGGGAGAQRRRECAHDRGQEPEAPSANQEAAATWGLEGQDHARGAWGKDELGGQP